MRMAGRAAAAAWAAWAVWTCNTCDRRFASRKSGLRPAFSLARAAGRPRGNVPPENVLQLRLAMDIERPRMDIERLNPALPAARALIDRSDAYLTALYPPASNHLESVAALGSPNVLFLGASVAGELAGCGAVKTRDDDGIYGEIKRVFVLEQYRGRGISKRIMEALEAHLVAGGIRVARLETGIWQPEAIGLYKRLGYVERPPFGPYRADPLSLFMEKRLVAEKRLG